MAFEFGTNWSVLARMSGPIQGPLLAYETFTAFCLEASFFGILLFGRSRVRAVVLSVLDRDGRAGHHALGLLDHGQQQLDAGAGRLCRRERRRSSRMTGPRSSSARCVWVRFPHMLLASYLTGAFCVAATGAWYLLRGEFHGRGAHHAAHGPVSRGRAGAGAALLRAPQRRICRTTTSRRSSRRSRRAGTTSSRRRSADRVAGCGEAAATSSRSAAAAVRQPDRGA